VGTRDIFESVERRLPVIQALRYAGMFAHILRDLPNYLRRPLTPAAAVSLLRRRLTERPTQLVRVAEQLIYRVPRSPYRRLLLMAGCEPGDFRALVEAEGVEGALKQLARQGVYVTYEELRGDRPIVRGSQQFVVSANDFANPRTAAHLERWSGGSRSSGTTVRTSLNFAGQLAVDLAVALHAHGLDDAEHIFWRTAPFHQYLRHAKIGREPIAWFYPLSPLPRRVRLAAQVLRIYGGRYGHPLVAPTPLDLRQPERLVAWLTERLELGRPICLTSSVSLAVRTAVAAHELGESLKGVYFLATGEPFTRGAQQAIASVGGRALLRFSSVETGNIGYGCAEAIDHDDLHLLEDHLALIQQGEIGDANGVPSDALLLTSLLPSAPLILLNYRNGDYGTVCARDCGCALGSLGLRRHLSQVGSYEKLTSEGMSFVKTRLVSTLDEALPRHFGGTRANYQILEQADELGLNRLYLLVDPRLGELDGDELRRVFLTSLRGDSTIETFMSTIWDRAGAVQVRREMPHVTASGKTPFYHLAVG
jgi:hypothetical protein